MSYLIKENNNYYIVPDVSDGDFVVFESDNEQELEAAKKIAKKFGLIKIQ